MTDVVEVLSNCFSRGVSSSMSRNLLGEFGLTQCLICKYWWWGRLYFWDSCWKLEKIPSVYRSPTILMPLSTQLLSVLSAMGLGIVGLFHSGVFLKSDPLNSTITWASCLATKVFCIIGLLVIAFSMLLLPKKGTTVSSAVLLFYWNPSVFIVFWV